MAQDASSLRCGHRVRRGSPAVGPLALSHCHVGPDPPASDPTANGRGSSSGSDGSPRRGSVPFPLHFGSGPTASPFFLLHLGKAAPSTSTSTATRRGTSPPPLISVRSGAALHSLHQSVQPRCSAPPCTLTRADVTPRRGRASSSLALRAATPADRQVPTPPQRGKRCGDAVTHSLYA